MTRRILSPSFGFDLFLRLPGAYRVSWASTTWLFVFCFSACDSRSDHERYVEWIRDYENEAHTRSQTADFTFDLQYQPAEYVLLQRGLSNLSETAKRAELEKISGVQYYTLVISTHRDIDLVDHNAHNAIEKQRRLYYFSYSFQNDITLEENGQVLPCVLYHFERSVAPGRGRTFVLGFENSPGNSEEAKVVIRSELFGALPVKIKISKTNIPQVVL